MRKLILAAFLAFSMPGCGPQEISGLNGPEADISAARRLVAQSPSACMFVPNNDYKELMFSANYLDECSRNLTDTEYSPGEYPEIRFLCEVNNIVAKPGYYNPKSITGEFSVVYVKGERRNKFDFWCSILPTEQLKSRQFRRILGPMGSAYSP